MFSKSTYPNPEVPSEHNQTAHDAHITYGSVCSGIEAASVAWVGLGWKAAWFAEIERFPAAVLAHHYPDVPNLGDMTKIAAAVRAGTVTAPAVMVGGTPCQAFSIAGLRKSLDDPRGQLTLSYIDLANAIDEKRIESGDKPAVHLWENVPGSLSTPDNAFGYFLAGMAGETEAFEPGPRPEPGRSSDCWRWKKSAEEAGSSGEHVARWPKSGCVYGRQRKIAWRLIDAQYLGVAQRRRRLFVVASARNDIDPAEILLEFDGVRRDSPPCRKTGAAVAALTASGVGVGGPDFAHAAAGHLVSEYVNSSELSGCNSSYSPAVAFGGGNCSGALDVAACLTAKGQRNDFDVETFAVQSATGEVSHTLTAEGYDASEDGTGRGTPVVALPLITSRCEVRRLTPKECERLQGFPDGYTLIPQDKRNALAADELAYLRLMHPDIEESEAHRLAADGPRYKAIGNSMAVPVMRWIGERIASRIGQADIPAKAVTELPPAAKKKRKRTTPAVNSKYARSFLKWAGGKYSVIDEIMAVLPTGKRLIEPFVGSGTVFINAGFESNLLGDVNPDLINLFQQLQMAPDEVIQAAHALERSCQSAKAYEGIRSSFNTRQSDALQQAVLFLALMRTCYNGLCRYNEKGIFNVGWNKKGEKNYFPLDELAHFTGLAKTLEFMCSGFEDVIAQAGEGDVVFCDPPYEPMPDESGFTAYSGTAFRYEDQERLVACLVAASQRGARVVVTNSSAPSMLTLYIRNGFQIAPLPTRRSVSCKGETRKKVIDIIASI